jgi:hypothetical protein
MKKILMTTLLAGILSVGCNNIPASEMKVEAPQDQTVSLFNGQNFDGWKQVGGKHKYAIENGMIVGTSVANESNAFMTTNQKYKDFELTFDVKLQEPYSLNSGCQIRSIFDPKAANGHLLGPQVEIATTGKAGFVYGEKMMTAEGGRRGWLSTDLKTCKEEQKAAAFKKGEWNHFRILVVGNRYRTWINGVQMTDFENGEMSEAGHIGLQVHSSKGPKVGKTVSWKNIRLRPISK